MQGGASVVVSYKQNRWRRWRLAHGVNAAGVVSGMVGMSLVASCGPLMPNTQSLAEHSLTSSVADSEAGAVHTAGDVSILATEELMAVLDGVQPWQDKHALDQESAYGEDSYKSAAVAAAEPAAAPADSGAEVTASAEGVSRLDMILEQVLADAALVVGSPATAATDAEDVQDSESLRLVVDEHAAVAADNSAAHHDDSAQQFGESIDDEEVVAVASMAIDVVVEQQVNDAVVALIKDDEYQSVSQLGAAGALQAHVHHPVFGHEIIEALKQAAQELVRRQVFPLSSVPLFDYTTGGREFGASRDGGWRNHAAADLLEYPGAPVHAIAAGQIIEYDYFYESTSAIVIDHGEFVIRYGEIDYFWDASLRVGSNVETGQKIAGVGQLWSGGSMLHIEQYGGTLTGPLTDPYNYPFQRRDDLMDVTPLLLSLENSLLSAETY